MALRQLKALMHGFPRVPAIKPVAVGRLQRDLPVLDGIGLTTVIIAHYRPFRKGLANIQRERRTIPDGTLVGELRGAFRFSFIDNNRVGVPERVSTVIV